MSGLSHVYMEILRNDTVGTMHLRNNHCYIRHTCLRPYASINMLRYNVVILSHCNVTHEWHMTHRYYMYNFVRHIIQPRTCLHCTTVIVNCMLRYTIVDANMHAYTDIDATDDTTYTHSMITYCPISSRHMPVCQIYTGGDTAH